MAEAAAEKDGPLSEEKRNTIRAFAASVDNVGAFFGEDIFLAMSSVLLIKGFLEQNHIIVQPRSISLWSIPTAIAAALIHGTRLWLLDRKLKQSPPPRGEVGERSDPGGGGARGSPHPKNSSLRFEFCRPPHEGEAISLRISYSNLQPSRGIAPPSRR
jgi:hypothetical protein